MSSICNEMWRCCFGRSERSEIYEKLMPTERYQDDWDREIANKALSSILNGKGDSEVTQADLDGIVGAQGWTEDIAKAVLDGLATAIREGADMSEDVKKISDVASKLAHELFSLAENHPEATAIFCTVAAIGVLFLLTPWVLELLGFAAEGPVAETFAARWQSRYLGYVPEGSWFSFFQRLGMIIGRA
ncbi:hypothetical protein SCUP234_08497 [Seiridium cupressi]